MKGKGKLLVLICLFSMLAAGCQKEPVVGEIPIPEPEIAFLVETAVDYHRDEPGYLRMDIRFPRIGDEVPGSESLNERLETQFPNMGEEQLDGWGSAEGYPYSWYRYDYTVTDMDGICSLTIHNTVSSAYGSYYPYRWVTSYYYDRNTGAVLDKDQYITALGYTWQDIIEAYLATHCPAYTPDMIEFDQILFYFDQQGTLQFIFTIHSLNIDLEAWPLT